ncbi:TlpA family protein disulfide reductase [Sphingobacterium athyrii]|uniref:TlpA family protein disulfide reductase n=2 Tax=Sphingobacterium TaxID=28453 RepID=UPI0028AD732C|nr:TlpA disulfide reductase family protein [Sphingobacterium athyrii]
MNVFFRAGELLPNFSIKLLYSALLSVLCFSMFSLSAQTPRKDSGAGGLNHITALKIGDTIPEALWNRPLQVVNHPSGKDEITLNDYRDKKLIILDFWATWCGSCISGMAKVKEIQRALNNDFAVLPITDQHSKEVTDAFDRIELLKQSNFGSIVEDSLFANYFPHRMIPHTVWLAPSGKILAITDGKDVEEKSILQAIQGNVDGLKQKKDVLNFDSDSSIFFRNVYGIDQEIRTQSAFSDNLPGLPAVSGIRRKPGATRIYGINQSLLLLYGLAYPELASFGSARIDCSAALVEKYFPAAGKGNEDKLFSYELLTRGMSLEKQRKKIVQDLDFFFRVKTGFVKKKKKCLVLTDISSNSNQPRNESEETISIERFRGDIEYARGIPTINESKRSSIPSELKKWIGADLSGLNKQLSDYSLALTPAVREIEVFQIKEDLR